MDYKRYSQCLIEAIRCLLKDGNGKEKGSFRKPEDLSWKELYRLAAFHSLTVIAYEAFKKELEEILSQGEETEEEFQVIKKWKVRSQQCIAQGITQAYEKERILDAFSREGVRLVPLKGCIMKQLYPSPQYRQMADLDLLIEPGKAGVARDIMTGLGYETELYEKSNHDKYIKEPFVSVEIHRKLVPDLNPHSAYYQDIWSKIREDRLSLEDNYLYMLVHFAKHFYGSGSGIRSILDIAVYLNHFHDKMDWKYISQELRTLDLTEFERDARELSGKWFGQENPTEAYKTAVRIADSEMEDYIIRSGSYGTSRQRIKNTLYRMNGNKKYNRKTIWRYTVTDFMSCH